MSWIWSNKISGWLHITASVVDTKPVWSVFGKHWSPPKLPPESPAGRSLLVNTTKSNTNPSTFHQIISTALMSQKCCLSSRNLLSCDEIAFFNCWNVLDIRCFYCVYKRSLGRICLLLFFKASLADILFL